MSRHVLRSAGTILVTCAAPCWLACAPGPAPEPAAGPDSAQSFRTTRPAAGPQPELHAPVPTHRILPNGLTLFTVYKPGLPLVHASIVVRGGAAADPKQRLGLAGFLAETLKAGTASRSAEQIADEVETLGSSLHADAESEAITLSFAAMTENFAPVFDVVTDVLRHPAFANKEIERVRRKRLAALTQANDDPRHSVSRVFVRAVFGAHPYGHTILGTRAAIEKISAADLRAYYEQHVRPGNAAVIIVGDLAEEQAVIEVTRRLGEWSGGAADAAPPPPPPVPVAPVIALVNRPNAPQSQVRIGHLGVARSHPDYFRLVMLNAILGGLFNSRINMNLREDKGYTYGARSAFNFERGGGSFFVSSAVRTDVTGPAITEVIEEINRIRKEDVTAEELDGAKARYSLSLPGYFQSVSAIGGIVSNLYLYELPLDYYQRLPDQIRAVSIADVRRVATEVLDPAQLSIVVVGDRAEVAPGLAALGRGPVQLVDADGEPVHDVPGRR